MVVNAPHLQARDFTMSCVFPAGTYVRQITQPRRQMQQSASLTVEKTSVPPSSGATDKDSA